MPLCRWERHGSDTESSQIEKQPSDTKKKRRKAKNGDEEEDYVEPSKPSGRKSVALNQPTSAKKRSTSSPNKRQTALKTKTANKAMITKAPVEETDEAEPPSEALPWDGASKDLQLKPRRKTEERQSASKVVSKYKAVVSRTKAKDPAANPDTVERNVREVQSQAHAVSLAEDWTYQTDMVDDHSLPLR